MTSPLPDATEDGYKILLLSILAACSLRLLGAGFEPLAVLLQLLAYPAIARTPAYGVIALLAATLGMKFIPSPQDMGFLMFVLNGAWWAICSVRHGLQSGGIHIPRFLIVTTGGIIGWLAINRWQAIQGDVPLGLWLRGIAPFVVIGYAALFALPCYRTVSRQVLWQMIALTVGVLCLILSLDVIVTYITLHLWKRTHRQPPVQRFMQSDIYDYFKKVNGEYPEKMLIKMRISGLIPDAQGSLLPLGAVGFYAASLALPTRMQRVMALIAASVCLCAVTVTLTRSMLLCALLGQGIIALCWLRCLKELRHAMIYGLCMVFATGAFAVQYHTADDLIQRMAVLIDNAYILGSSTEEDAIETTEATEAPSPSLKKAPSSSLKKDTSSPSQKTPSPSLQKAPYSSLKKDPSSSSQKTPSPSLQKAPYSSLKKDPSSSLQKAPSPSLKKDPSSSSQKQVENQAKRARAEMDIGYRAQEYQRAWESFMRSPVFGEGFGHTLRLKVANDAGKITLYTPTYVHNWVLYSLMVGGASGFLVFSGLFIGGFVSIIRQKKVLPDALRFAMAGGLLSLLLYGLFFAVFRSFYFMLIMAVLLGGYVQDRSSDKPS